MNEKLMIICINCDKQVKSNEMKFLKALHYKYLQCKKCKGIHFKLCKK